MAPDRPRAARPSRQPGGLRERKRRRTRQRLSDAAWALAHAGGWEAVTVEEIAHAAEVSRSTFFRYFAGKDAVLFTWREALFEAFQAELGRREAGEPGFQAVRRALLHVAILYERDRAAIVRRQRVIDASPALVGHEYAVDRAWEDAIAAALHPHRGGGGDAAARRGGDAAARRDAQLRAGAILGVLRVTLRHWIADGGRSDLVAAGGEALDLLDPEAPPAMARAPARRRTR